jgi:ParB/RepB/Spo0J family partition protein
MTVQVPVGLIDPAADNPRASVGDISELADTIGRFGVLQPLVLTPKPDGRYLIVAGHRRHAAAREAGLPAVPAVLREFGSEQERLAAMIVENVHRENLTKDERAALYLRLRDEFGLNNRQIGELVGKSQSHVGQTLLLLRGEETRRAELADVRERRLRGETVIGRPLAGSSPADVIRKLRESDERYGQSLTHEQCKTALRLIETAMRALARQRADSEQSAAA